MTQGAEAAGGRSKIVALMGCMVGPKTDALEARFPHVDVFMRPQQYEPLLDLVGERLGRRLAGGLGSGLAHGARPT